MKAASGWGIKTAQMDTEKAEINFDNSKWQILWRVQDQAKNITMKCQGRMWFVMKILGPHTYGYVQKGPALKQPDTLVALFQRRKFSLQKREERNPHRRKNT